MVAEVNYFQKIWRLGVISALALMPSLSLAEEAQVAPAKFGATIGASYGLGRMQNTDMRLPERTMGVLSMEALVGYRINAWLIGLDFDYSDSQQLTGLTDAGGTNLEGRGWILGVGGGYDFSPQLTLQGSLGFAGKYQFNKQTDQSQDDHLSKPLALRLKAQYSPKENSPLSLDLDLRYTAWKTFDIAGAEYSNDTKNWMVGVGVTYHFGRGATDSSSAVVNKGNQPSNSEESKHEK